MGAASIAFLRVFVLATMGVGQNNGSRFKFVNFVRCMRTFDVGFMMICPKFSA
jgi:hypothetical protein